MATGALETLTQYQLDRKIAATPSLQYDIVSETQVWSEEEALRYKEGEKTIDIKLSVLLHAGSYLDSALARQIVDATSFKEVITSETN